MLDATITEYSALEDYRFVFCEFEELWGHWHSTEPLSLEMNGDGLGGGHPYRFSACELANGHEGGY